MPPCTKRFGEGRLHEQISVGGYAPARFTGAVKMPRAEAWGASLLNISQTIFLCNLIGVEYYQLIRSAAPSLAFQACAKRRCAGSTLSKIRISGRRVELAHLQFSAGTLWTLRSNPPDQALRKGFTGRTELWLGTGLRCRHEVSSTPWPGWVYSLRDRPYEGWKRGLARRVGSPRRVED